MHLFTAPRPILNYLRWTHRECSSLLFDSFGSPSTGAQTTIFIWRNRPQRLSVTVVVRWITSENCITHKPKIDCSRCVSNYLEPLMPFLHRLVWSHTNFLLRSISYWLLSAVMSDLSAVRKCLSPRLLGQLSNSLLVLFNTTDWLVRVMRFCSSQRFAFLSAQKKALQNLTLCSWLSLHLQNTHTKGYFIIRWSMLG